MSSSPASRLSLLQLYRRLLRSAEKYPSMKRPQIYQAIREDFRAHASLSPDDDKTKQQVAIAYQGLSQLQQFDQVKMSGGQGGAWTVNLEQNPMPRPPLPEEEKE